MRFFVLGLVSFLQCCASARAAGGPLDPNNIDNAVDARSDFYQHANGGWLRNTKIPDEYARWGTFEQLNDDVQKTLHDITEGASKNAAAQPGSVPQKVGDFYASAMDTAAIETAGVTPLQPLLQQISRVRDAGTLAETVASLHVAGMGAVFGFGARPDDKDSSTIIAQLGQGGLGLPERDYYFAEDKAEIRAEYKKHIANMLGLLGDRDPVAGADQVMALETELARASFTAVERRDPERTYNKRELAQLTTGTQPFDWATYFRGVGLPKPGPINAENPNFFARVGELAHTTDMAHWQTYLRWNLARGSAPVLPEAFVNESFHFYGKVLQGTPSLRPRWKRVLSMTDGLLGEALGQLYVAEAFPPEAKEHASKIVETLREAMKERLNTLEWMTPETREKALTKLGTFRVKIGYPDKWIDYTSLHIDRASYAKNVQRAEAFELAREVARIGKPVDRTRWEMTPQTVNAYYDPQMNEIVFPAAILQNPFFDLAADDAFNYGGMGAVIGHEMTHGYDDQGRQYDAEGNLKDWWTPEDAKHFKERSTRIVAQFSGYRTFDHAVNGDLTQGENIADLGGLKIAYLAYRKHHAHAEVRGEDGFTGAQRFFLAWAQIWRNQVRKEAALQRLATDPHSPGEWRVNGPLQNMPEFYEAWGVRDGDGMFRPEDVRVAIW